MFLGYLDTSWQNVSYLELCKFFSILYKRFHDDTKVLLLTSQFQIILKCDL